MVGYQGGKEVMNWETGMDICVYMCVYIYIYTHVCIYIYTHTHTHTIDTMYEIDNY